MSIMCVHVIVLQFGMARQGRRDREDKVGVGLLSFTDTDDKLQLTVSVFIKHYFVIGKD